MSLGGRRLFDQLREIPRGVDPSVLVEWSDIIERKANEGCGGSNAGHIRFKGTVNEEGRFALDVDAPNPDAMVCLLRAIQDRLDVMPVATGEFYGALMVALASEADENDRLNKDS